MRRAVQAGKLGRSAPLLASLASVRSFKIASAFLSGLLEPAMIRGIDMPMTSEPADLHDHLHRTLRRLCRRYRKAVRDWERDIAEETVHELRIATRRLLAKLHLIEALHPGKPVQQARRILKRRLEALAPLRDTHVQLLEIESLLGRAPDATPFRDRLRQRERRILRELKRDQPLAKPRKLDAALKRLRRELRHRARRDHDRQVRQAVFAVVDEAFARVIDRWHAVDPEEPLTIHNMRVAFKRFRYLVESLQPICPGLEDAQLIEMQKFQDRMGRIQDATVLLEGLDRFERKHPERAAPELRRAILRRRRALVRQFLRSAHRDLPRFWPGAARPRAARSPRSSAVR